jgi:cell wall-associated NlpC family hydrolase
MNKRLFLSVIGAAVLVGCATRPAPTLPPMSAQETNKRQDIVMQAMAMLDRGYTYGGKKLHTGFDCSGLVSFVYKESAGMSVRGSAESMARNTRAVDAGQARPGDLVFFNTLGHSASHVGIYIGSGKFIHAANERTGVKLERLDAPYWKQAFEGYRSAFAN